MGASGHNQTSPVGPITMMLIQFTNDDDGDDNYDDNDEDLDDHHVQNRVPISVLNSCVHFGRIHPPITFGVNMTQYGGDVQMFRCSDQRYW